MIPFFAMGLPLSYRGINGSPRYNDRSHLENCRVLIAEQQAEYALAEAADLATAAATAPPSTHVKTAHSDQRPVPVDLVGKSESVIARAPLVGRWSECVVLTWVLRGQHAQEEQRVRGGCRRHLG